ncbi:MAG: D-alanyl-D-alanine carboxypeptidase family protein [Clostridiales bacterium]|nr:D-alanyl-D-alanine carboxypeptidase family protein [Clostridiales bacterium]
MRINSNYSVHKLKKDPYRILLRLTGILAALAVVCFVAYNLCNAAIGKDIQAKRTEIDNLNEQAEIQYNTELNERRNNAGGFSDPMNSGEEAEDLPVWERTLEGSTWRVEDMGKKAVPENTRDVTLSRGDLLLGGMMLINPWHSVPSDYNYETLVSVGSASGYKIQVDDSSVRLFPAAYDALSTMITDAETAGFDSYLVREGYRSNDEQREMFENKMAELSDDFSGDILMAQAKKEVNYPGTSEYETGFSFRMDLYKSGENLGKFSESERGQWFIENSWKYGIIFRFPVEDFPNSSWESKTYKTGISSRMNLFRYVGKPHAAVMRAMDYCLEEYVEFLMEHPYLRVYEDGALRYEIYRIPCEDEYMTSFSLPMTNTAVGFQASFDNMGGIVLAYIY